MSKTPVYTPEFSKLLTRVVLLGRHYKDCKWDVLTDDCTCFGVVLSSDTSPHKWELYVEEGNYILKHFTSMRLIDRIRLKGESSVFYFLDEVMGSTSLESTPELCKYRAVPDPDNRAYVDGFRSPYSDMLRVIADVDGFLPIRYDAIRADFNYDKEGIGKTRVSWINHVSQCIKIYESFLEMCAEDRNS